MHVNTTLMVIKPCSKLDCSGADILNVTPFTCDEIDYITRITVQVVIYIYIYIYAVIYIYIYIGIVYRFSVLQCSIH